ncbi:diguanylate cyclase [Vibrio sp. JC009]|uniref:diguanylate cyclase n=1 Tax=Vibrio sp. JC009 TaxID=2912314 RepID=UPI0023B1BE09|nr:diguanylate cyclase [Vibrio sp. JC009]WED24525.1 diguanylate cyclase [Vibrio sp. JC009]
MAFRARLGHIPMIFLVSAFLTLDFSLLFINLNLSEKLENDALVINLTGRQRMLSQRVAKSGLLSCPSADTCGNTNPRATQELTSAANLFNQTLLSLKNSGYVNTPDGKKVVIDAIKDDISQQYMTDALALWEEVYLVIQKGQENDFAGLNISDVSLLSQYANETNKKVLFLMNELTVRSERLSIQNTETLRVAQVTIFILVIINFLLIVYRFHRADKEQAEFMQQLESLIRNLPQAVFFVDAHDHIIYVNQLAEELLNIPAEEIKQKTIDKFLPTPVVDGSVNMYGKNLEISVSNVMSIPREMRMVSLTDVTESVVLKKKSAYDPLTQLLNRNGLSEAFDEIKGKTNEICCLFLDLNKFKEVNDHYGHGTGDQVLKVVAHRLKASMKKDDIIARFGGDEFIVILNKKLSPTDIHQLCDRIKHVIAKEIDIEHLVIQIGVSIGVRVGYPADESLEIIIDDADRAMYVDKKQEHLI